MSLISKLTTLGAAGAGSETEQYVAIACSGTVTDLRNSLIVIPFTKSGGFGDFQNIPSGSTAPPNRPATYSQVAWSPDGGAIIFTHFDSPLVSAYAFTSGDSWAIGSKYSNPSPSLLGSSATGLALSNAGDYVAVGTNNSGAPLHTYAWSDSSGFGSTRYIINASNGVEPRALAWSPTDNWIASLGVRGKAVPWTGSGYGTIDDTLTNVSTQYRVTWNNAGDHILFSAVSSTATHRFLIFTWDDSTGFGTNVSPSIPYQAYDAKFSPDDKSIVFATNSLPYVKAYEWDNSTSTLGSLLTDATSYAAARGTNVSFNTDGDVVFLGVDNAKLIEAYEFDSINGFGAKYDRPDLTGFPTSGPHAAGITYKDFG